MPDASDGVLRIGNASGFYGDRFDAMRDMLTDGPLDVLTGDYLAELTMLVLGRDRQKNPALGYAKTFLRQLEECLGLAHDRGVKIVANAGGLNPEALADAVRALAARLGLPAEVAHVEGDDLPAHDWGPEVLTANAYLGGAGIAACLRAGADIVVTGRVTDAALVSGPAAARFGWGPEDLDALAGAVVAGRVLECGAEATGGDHAFFTGIDAHALRRPGFPLAEIHPDGVSVITKHPGTGGLIDVGTVTAQLLYGTGGARHAGPDVTARLDTVRLAQEGPDRVRISGVRGEPPPPTLKVGLNRIGGWRNEAVFVLTGPDIDARARCLRDRLEDALGREGTAAGAARPAEVRWELARAGRSGGGEERAGAYLRLVVRDGDPAKVGRAMSGATAEPALGGDPGLRLTAPPGKGAPYGVFEARYVDADAVPHIAVLPDGRRMGIPGPARTGGTAPAGPEVRLPEPWPPGPVRCVPLGLIAGARSGDRGGDATLGVWARSDDAWRWLAHELTADCLRGLLPETAGLPVVRQVLPHLRALNFTVLGEGVAGRARFDPRGKALGEQLRARYIEIPEALL
ncbi:acyclic terpene utilization AtuA family protein [Streptomyces sp. NPDC020141]|uniref:acyclic terpene utilization AtuA family protein n=1 Tax=Streptomyces sp. NPDC020141 TaxID=3365065 RepID=UPI0037AB8E2D